MKRNTKYLLATSAEILQKRKDDMKRKSLQVMMSG